MIVTILNYKDGRIRIENVPKDMEEKEGDEIVSSMGYSLDDVLYMINENFVHIDAYTSNVSLNVTIK